MGFELVTSLMGVMRHSTAMVGVVVLGACGEARVGQSPSEILQISRSSTNIPDNGVFYRVRAKYELLETGEPIDFNFVVSCYNRDVPGSFHGIIFPEVMFKATSTGAAISVSPEEHYCERASKRLALVKKNDPIKMPILAWYPDVKNLSFAEVYMTNDAYLGPRAKVRFVDFKIEMSDRIEFETWYQYEEKNYKQIGAIPGPFGCLTENVNSSTNIQACFHPKNLELNNGNFQVIADDGLSILHGFSRPMFADNVDDIKPYVHENSNFFCPVYWKYQGNDKIRDPFLEDIDSGVASAGTTNFQLSNHRGILKTKTQDLFTYLEPDCLHDPNTCGSIAEVFPIIIHKNGRQIIQNLIRDNDYLGFAFMGQASDSIFDTPQNIQSNKNMGLFLLNNQLICEAVTPQQFFAYDIENKSIILTDPF